MWKNKEINLKTKISSGIIYMKINKKEKLFGWGMRGNQMESDKLFAIEQDGRCGWWKDGKIIISCVFEDTRDFKEGVGWYQLTGLWGLMGRNGKPVIPPRYQEVGDFEGGKAKVKLAGKWIIIDKEGNTVQG